MKHDTLPTSKLHRIRMNLTLDPDELEADAFSWALGEMLDELPAGFSLLRFWPLRECDQNRNRPGSRRVFLTLLGQPTPAPTPHKDTGHH